MTNLDPKQTFGLDEPDRMVEGVRRAQRFNDREDARADRPVRVEGPRHLVRDALAFIGASAVLAVGISWASSEIDAGAGAPGAATVEHSDIAARNSANARATATALGEPAPAPLAGTSNQAP